MTWELSSTPGRSFPDQAIVTCEIRHCGATTPVVYPPDGTSTLARVQAELDKLGWGMQPVALLWRGNGHPIGMADVCPNHNQAAAA